MKNFDLKQQPDYSDNSLQDAAADFEKNTNLDHPPEENDNIIDKK